MKFKLIEDDNVKHLRDFFDKIDFVVIVPNIEDFHFSTDEVVDESLYNEAEDVEIYREENLLYLTDKQLMQIPVEQISAFTNVELIERIYRIDKEKLSFKQIELLQTYYEKYRAVISREDVQYFLNKLHRCNNVSVIPRTKNDAFFNLYNLVEKDKYAVIRQLKVSDYVESRKSYNIGHLGNNLIIFQPDTIIIDGNIFKGVTIYIKIDLNMTSDTTVVAISFHDTNMQDSKPYKSN